VTERRSSKPRIERRTDCASLREAKPVIRVHVAADLEGVPLGTVLRELGESAARYRRRSAAIERVFRTR
jgi:hypothetical protein